MFCPNCGTPLSDNPKFCPRCKENLSDINIIDSEKPVNNPTKSTGDVVVVFLVIFILTIIIIAFAGSASK